MPLDLVATLSELVATPSVNPMGRALSGPEFLEGRMTDHLERLFARLGLASQRQTIEPGRDNIIAWLPADDPAAPVLMLEAHQDTVPVDGMTIEPFTPHVEAGRLYGRGSCDIKGGMAAMLVALSRLAEERPAGRATIVMACSVNEEFGSSGAAAFGRLWGEPRSARSTYPRPAAAIVAEPTSLNVVVAHKGTARWRCHTTGVAVHSSQPERGVSAIYRMAKVLAALETYAREVVPGLASHALCGRPTLSVGTIAGGISVNTVPDRCTIEIDRRVVPGEQPSQARQHVIDYLRGVPGLDFALEHDPPFSQGMPLAETGNGPLAERLAAVARRMAGTGKLIGVPYGTDAPSIAAAGIPAVVFGPGSIESAHTIDESVPLDEVAQASEILYELAAHWNDAPRA